MSDTKISDLTNGVTKDATDRIPVARSPFAPGDSRYLAASLFETAGAAAAAQAASQPLDSDLTAIAALTTTAYGRAFLALADAAAARTAAGLGTIATQAANAVTITGGTINDATVGATTPAPVTGTTITATTGLVASLLSPSADVFEQRRTTNPQTLQVYNTYTDVSNYERATLKWSGNAWSLVGEAAGTGNTTRWGTVQAGGLLLLKGGDGIILYSNVTSDRWELTTSGHFRARADNTYDFGASGANRPRTGYFGTSIVNAGYDEFAEMTAPSAPAANRVRFYAEDNGSGKTRLMALFPTGAAQQVAIEP